MMETGTMRLQLLLALLRSAAKTAREIGHSKMADQLDQFQEILEKSFDNPSGNKETTGNQCLKELN